jgi:hypothetical protein
MPKINFVFDDVREGMIVVPEERRITRRQIMPGVLVGHVSPHWWAYHSLILVVDLVNGDVICESVPCRRKDRIVVISPYERGDRVPHTSLSRFSNGYWHSTNMHRFALLPLNGQRCMFGDPGDSIQHTKAHYFNGYNGRRSHLHVIDTQDTNKLYDPMCKSGIDRESLLVLGGQMSLCKRCARYAGT